MDITHILDNLNEAQHKAVTSPPGHLLILAGAGSGKTRVLVHRIAWLIHNEKLSPHSILAVTFTNKAANEMRHRIESLLDYPSSGMWVGTFHGLAHRLLRSHWQEAGLPQSFQILDSDDQYRLIRRVLQTLNCDEDNWPPKQAQWFINAQKDEGLRPHQLQDEGDYYNKTMIRIYQAYEEACARSGVIDFAELLLRVYELWLKNPDLLAHYQQRFPHILVDEFQDTNAIQYAWLRLLVGQRNHLMIVGDDDQSIYGWRGAKIENIQRFNHDFPDSSIIRLEQNYRSTGIILAAANALIAHNNRRLGKNLWTQGHEGEPISLYAGFNDLDEARFIVEHIQQGIMQGLQRSEIAVLYRSNAQSRVIEEALINGGIPYRVYGGLRFFDRAEIKDALAYLRLIANRDDDAAFERVVNTPTRGIGEQTIATLRNQARTYNQSLWRTALQLVSTQELTARATNALASFLQLIEKLAADTASMTLSEQTEHTLHESTLFAHYQKEKGEKGQARVENLEELVNAAKQFNPLLSYEETNLPPLASFLAHVALEAGEHQGEPSQDCVQLMTLHSAKGLEFPLVFLCGLEEGLFPHRMSSEELTKLEEERRLCYVGMTRAMHKLYLTYAEMRRLHGSENYHHPSRFIREIPKEYVQEVRFKSSIQHPLRTSSARAVSFTEPEFSDDNGLSLGQRVVHPTFGEGVILNVEGQGSHARVQIKFDREGAKWLVVAYANLQPAYA